MAVSFQYLGAKISGLGRVMVSVTNDLQNDQRVHKVCQSLHNEGWDVHLVGRKLKTSTPLQRDYSTCRIRMLFNRGALFYAEYNFRLFFYLLFKPIGVLHSNDLDTLLANYLVSKLRRRQLIYDSHEYFTEVPELQGRKLVKNTWKSIEKWVFPDLKYIFTVNQSIAKLYSKEYHKSINVIRNIPNRTSKISRIGKEDMGFGESDYIIIVQGTGINVDRGIEEMVEAMALLPDDIHLMIIGKGDVLPQLKGICTELGLDDRVHFEQPKPYDEMMKITSSCDLGISLDKDTNINYRFSLPNKIFDYIRAEIPILCTQLPELTRVVEGYHIGKTIEYPSPNLIKEAVLELKEKGKERFTENLKVASSQLAWEIEVLPLLKVYNQIKKGSNPI